MFIPNSKLDMPELLYPGREPVGKVKIDWSNPTTKGLRLAVFLLEDRGLADLAFNTVINARTGTSIARDNVKKHVANISGASGGLGLQHPNLSGVSGSIARTFIGCFKQSSATVDITNGTYYGAGAESSGNKLSFRADFGNNDALRVEHGAGYVTANTTVPYSKAFTAAFVLRPGASLDNVEIYLNGVIDGNAGNWLSSANSSTTNLNTSVNPLLISSDHSSNRRSLNGNVYWYLDYEGDLSSEAVKSLHDNPYQFLIPA